MSCLQFLDKEPYIHDSNTEKIKDLEISYLFGDSTVFKH